MNVTNTDTSSSRTTVNSHPSSTSPRIHDNVTAYPTMIELLAKHVITKLMSGSPKMIQCGTDEIESPSHDTESFH